MSILSSHTVNSTQAANEISSPLSPNLFDCNASLREDEKLDVYIMEHLDTNLKSEKFKVTFIEFIKFCF